MKKLLEFVQDGDGLLSSSRLMFVLSGLSLVGIWIMQSIHEKKMASIDLSAIGFVTSMMAGKLVAGYSDNVTDIKKDSNPPQ